MSEYLSPAVRAYLYRIATAVAPVLVLYGVLSETEVAAFLGVLVAVLGTGTASAYTPRPRGRHEA